MARRKGFFHPPPPHPPSLWSPGRSRPRWWVDLIRYDWRWLRWSARPDRWSSKPSRDPDTWCRPWESLRWGYPELCSSFGPKRIPVRAGSDAIAPYPGGSHLPPSPAYQNWRPPRRWGGPEASSWSGRPSLWPAHPGHWRPAHKQSQWGRL